jgi:uncharacterized protein YggU (UPF0235/DUF167 family)
MFVKFNPTGKIQVSDKEITISLSNPERGKANKELIQNYQTILEVLR